MGTPTQWLMWRGFDALELSFPADGTEVGRDLKLVPVISLVVDLPFFTLPSIERFTYAS